MTNRVPLIKAHALTGSTSTGTGSTGTSTSTGTRFECFTPECRRTVMDSLDIEPGTVVVVGSWEAMRVVGDGSRNEKVWVGFDGRTYTHEEFADIVRSARGVVRVVHYGII